mmetsp:Transcript_2873/g.6461  ORF Transcript_2873/g.6461 Transcript_2873/m.6461 type:complete len:303 (+) Transcript_2873:1117-2025(+)
MQPQPPLSPMALLAHILIYVVIFYSSPFLYVKGGFSPRLLGAVYRLYYTFNVLAALIQMCVSLSYQSTNQNVAIIIIDQSERGLGGDVGVPPPHLANLRVPAHSVGLQRRMHVDGLVVIRPGRSGRLRQGHGPRQAGVEPAEVPLRPHQHRHHGDPQHERLAVRLLGQQHEAGERLRDEQRVDGQDGEGVPHGAAGFVRALVHVDDVVAPHHEVEDEEHHAHGGDDGRDGHEHQSDHQDHGKHAHLAPHAHGARAVLDGAVARGDDAAQAAQPLVDRHAQHTRVREDQALRGQVHAAEQHKG